MPPFDPAMQAPPGQMPPEQMSPGEQPMLPEEVGLSEGTVEATPEEQALLEKFVKKAWELTYADNTFPQVVEMLSGGGEGGDPVKGLAMATDMIVAKVAMAAEEAGEQIAPDVLYHAGADVLEDLAEISRVGKIKDYSQDPDGLESAWFQALDLYRDRLQKSGKLDQQSANADMQKLMRADQDGTLERIMRSLADSDQSGQAGGPVPEGRPKGIGAAMGMQ